ncbi:hypothetical protein ES703_74922 [subsurface metagenome]
MPLWLILILKSVKPKQDAKVPDASENTDVFARKSVAVFLRALRVLRGENPVKSVKSVANFQSNLRVVVDKNRKI